jgi:hypothetical protein
LRRWASAGKAAGSNSWSPLMVGIGIIVAFLIVIGGLNIFEFGRLD